MEIYASRKTFDFVMAVLGSTIRPITVNKLAVIDLQCIMTTLFVTLDILALSVPYLFDVLFVTIMTDYASILMK